MGRERATTKMPLQGAPRNELAGSVRSVGCPWDKALRSPILHFTPSSTGFLGEGDAVTKAIQDARQLLHSHSGALENSPNPPFRKVWATRPLPAGRSV